MIGKQLPVMMLLLMVFLISCKSTNVIVTIPKKTIYIVVHNNPGILTKIMTDCNRLKIIDLEILNFSNNDNEQFLDFTRHNNIEAVKVTFMKGRLTDIDKTKAVLYEIRELVSIIEQ